MVRRPIMIVSMNDTIGAATIRRPLKRQGLGTGGATFPFKDSSTAVIMLNNFSHHVFYVGGEEFGMVEVRRTLCGW